MTEPNLMRAHIVLGTFKTDRPNPFNLYVGNLIPPANKFDHQIMIMHNNYKTDQQPYVTNNNYKADV